MIYLDHAAATLPFPEVLKLAGDSYANPSSVHAPGRAVRAKLDKARRTIAETLECDTSAVIFTSGATEAIHLAVIGHYLARPDKRGVVYTSPLVHSCVWSALHFLEKNFAVTVKHLPINKSGFLDLDQVGEAHLAADLIITEYGNSEIGLLQPVTKLGKKLEKLAAETDQVKPALIVDAAAALVTEKIALEYQKCDFIAISAEKIGGLKGSGVLVRRSNQPLDSIIGGSHELGYRGGTENVVGAVALGQALALHSQSQSDERDHYVALHKQVRAYFEKELPACAITTPETNFLPHVFHFTVPGMSAPVLVAKADQAGLAISAGSACSSGATTASKVLLNLGMDEAQAESGVRLSWGRDTTVEDLKKSLEILKSLVS